MQCPLDDPRADTRNQDIAGVRLPRVSIARTPRGDWGARATAPISKGQLVMHYAGLAISEAEAADRIQQHMADGSTSYLLQVTDLVFVDARVVGSEARFLDRHCQGKARGLRELCQVVPR
eukprot:958671-Rhodomonas_salina.1